MINDIVDRNNDKKNLPQGEDLTMLKKLVDEKLIYLNNPKDYDDSYGIDYAIENQCIIVTNDCYRDYVEKKDGDEYVRWYINSHCLSYLFIGDDLRVNPDFVCPEYFEE